MVLFLFSYCLKERVAVRCIPYVAIVIRRLRISLERVQKIRNEIVRYYANFDSFSDQELQISLSSQCVAESLQEATYQEGYQFPFHRGTTPLQTFSVRFTLDASIKLPSLSPSGSLSAMVLPSPNQQNRFLAPSRGSQSKSSQRGCLRASAVCREEPGFRVLSVAFFKI